MKIILTVTGLDHTGIVGAVATELTRRDVNIENVSQSLMDEYFTMIMQCSFDENTQNLADLQDAMKQVGEAQKVKVRIQSEDIFKAMHSL